MKLARWVRLSSLLGACLCVSAPMSAAAQGDAAERERIGRERAAVQSAFSAQELECQVRFAITACVEEARRVRRNSLAELRRQSAALDETQRKQRAERRRQTIRDNLTREETEQRALALRAPREPRIVPLERPPAATRDGGKAARTSAARAPEARASAPMAAASAPSRRAQDAQSRANYEARQWEAQAHREDVMKRHEELASRRKPAPPLPLPAASKP